MRGLVALRGLSYSAVMDLELKDFPESVGQRLDHFLSEKIEMQSRSKIQKMIKAGSVLVGGEKVKSGYLLQEEDVIFVKLVEEAEKKIMAEDLDLEIVHEAKDFFVINKPPGMVVHPADGKHYSGTVVNALKGRIDDMPGERPGIVHRLDKDTSGLMIVARNEKARDYFVEQFKKKKVKKGYLALVGGLLKHKEGIIDAPIGRHKRDRKKMAINEEGKVAISQYKVLEEFRLSEFALSYLSVGIETGRTHQIRVHMKSIDHPLAGDDVYGSHKLNRFLEENFALKRQFLHASSLSFVPPGTKKALTFESELFDDLSKVLSQL